MRERVRDLPLERLEFTEGPRVQALPLNPLGPVPEHGDPLAWRRGLCRDGAGCRRDRRLNTCGLDAQLVQGGLPLPLEPVDVLLFERGGPQGRLDRLPLRRNRAYRVPQERLTGSCLLPLCRGRCRRVRKRCDRLGAFAGGGAVDERHGGPPGFAVYGQVDAGSAQSDHPQLDRPSDWKESAIGTGFYAEWHSLFTGPLLDRVLFEQVYTHSCAWPSLCPRCEASCTTTSAERTASRMARASRA
ncbi:hypothetical protein GCM10010842_30520 [Deinococcus daejeonensis]|uniref:Uncharacterized protein n=1 Tax=Deinococcus daejeonensis TaxID=1007098 RepID=A0ABQ2JB12_9DEIO|nr:hypothetical protein GCM10010842_30520 [Deinococcus daejeonensis]